MRLKFSPKHILLPNGVINQHVFVPDGTLVIDDNQWSDALTEKLFLGRLWVAVLIHDSNASLRSLASSYAVGLKYHFLDAYKGCQDFLGRRTQGPLSTLC